MEFYFAIFIVVFGATMSFLYLFAFFKIYRNRSNKLNTVKYMFISSIVASYIIGRAFFGNYRVVEYLNPADVFVLLLVSISLYNKFVCHTKYIGIKIQKDWLIVRDVNKLIFIDIAALIVFFS